MPLRAVPPFPLVDFLKILSDPTRLSIIFVLAEGSRTVNEMVEILQISQPSVSYHLGILRVTGILSSTRRGKTVVYAFGPKVRATKSNIQFDFDRGTRSADERPRGTRVGPIHHCFMDVV